MKHFIGLSIAVAVTCPILLALPAAFAVEPVKMKWTVEGSEREALVFVPANSGKEEQAPVIFFFHGHGGNMEGVARNTKLQDFWPQAIVVYPQGLPTTSPRDPEGTKPGWQYSNDRDLKFFDAMLATLREKHPVDDQRVYAAGFSNGAGFTYFLWAQRGKYLAAIAPCSGAIRGDYHPNLPRPTLIVTGEADPLVKIDEANKTIAEVKRVNGCSEEGKPWENPGTMIHASDKGAPLVTFIHPGAHVIPPGTNRLIVKFFKSHALEKEAAAK
jgi:polyhydroxybutyrate depolymerase